MSIYDSKLWIEDLDRVIGTLPELAQLNKKSVMITGISGQICSAVADIFIRYNEAYDGEIVIFAAGRSEQKIQSRFAEFVHRPYFRFVQYDANRDYFDLPVTTDYIIHGASNSSPDMIVKEPVETMTSNIVGLLALLNYANRRGKPKVLYVSSSEVYGKKEGNEPFRENQYGFVDLLDPRNSYSVAKRAAETLCVSYTDEYKVETIIVRPGHIYGPTAGELDRHVSSVWSYAAARAETIVMKSDGSQLRSYCYSADAASALIKVLLNGRNKCAYNISNPASIISIRQMAEILSKKSGSELKIVPPSDTEKNGFNPMSNSSLEGTSLQQLGWKGCFDAETGFSHTIEILKETRINLGENNL